MNLPINYLYYLFIEILSISIPLSPHSWARLGVTCYTLSMKHMITSLPVFLAPGCRDLFVNDISYRNLGFEPKLVSVFLTTFHLETFTSSFSLHIHVSQFANVIKYIVNISYIKFYNFI